VIVGNIFGGDFFSRKMSILPYAYQDYQMISSFCQEQGTLFTDPVFPPTDYSITPG
jgi:hypothetical protein